jgi:hypothetical protein
MQGREGWKDVGKTLLDTMGKTKSDARCCSKSVSVI